MVHQLLTSRGAGGEHVRPLADRKSLHSIRVPLYDRAGHAAERLISNLLLLTGALPAAGYS